MRMFVHEVVPGSRQRVESTRGARARKKARRFKRRHASWSWLQAGARPHRRALRTRFHIPRALLQCDVPACSCMCVDQRPRHVEASAPRVRLFCSAQADASRGSARVDRSRGAGDGAPLRSSIKETLPAGTPATASTGTRRTTLRCLGARAVGLQAPRGQAGRTGRRQIETARSAGKCVY